MNWKKIGLISSLASIVGSIAIYALHSHDLGIFVGLWASALLLLIAEEEEYNLFKKEKEQFEKNLSDRMEDME